MTEELHSFHIPVMGVGHSVDTPICMAPLGINSVISLVDDLLLEQIRAYYSDKNGLPYTKIPREAADGRAKRITAYLNMVRELVQKKFEGIRSQLFFENNEKKNYFELLPESSPLKVAYLKLQKLAPGAERDQLSDELTAKMKPGSIDVNIMVKLDRPNFSTHGQPLGDEFSDAKAALRGFAKSELKTNIIFSAGMNPKLFTYLAQFRDFYRDACGELRKKIIIKVSDFRSAFIQSKFLAKKGLEVSEFRIESGLNCGGHAFPSRGQLLPWILKEFKEKWHLLTESVQPLIVDYYKKVGWTYPETQPPQPEITAQGGIGNIGEVHRLQEEFGIKRTGWGSPFLLVPEATNVDDYTRELLRCAKEEDLYLSDMSPLQIPFNTVRGTASANWTKERLDEGHPGSPCPKGFAATSTEFTERPICLASRQYQKIKLAQIDDQDISEAEKENLKSDVVEKTCICHHLGNGIQVKLGLTPIGDAPSAICPGPNIAWFDRIYSLKEMVDHIYGRGPSLVPSHRPHMFAKEIEMNVDYFEKISLKCGGNQNDWDMLLEFKQNLEAGMDYCFDLAQKKPYEGENLASLKQCIRDNRDRLRDIFDIAQKTFNAHSHINSTELVN